MKVRKHPPHHPPIERFNERIILFVTLCAKARGSILDHPVLAESFELALSDADAWRVGLYVIMPDHIHMFCTPTDRVHLGIKKWSTFLKRRIAHHYHEATGRYPGWDWLPDPWDTQMRTVDHYHEKLVYVRMNPLRAGLVKAIEEWPYTKEDKPIIW